MPKDHYVPRFYLEGFVDSATKKLWVVDVKKSSVRPDSPKDAARISGYDNLQGNTVEDRLVASKAVKAIEDRAAPVIAKIRTQSYQLTFEDKDHLSNFIGLQISRVPVYRDRVDNRMDDELLKPHYERLREKVLSDQFESEYGKDAIMLRNRVLSGDYPIRLKFKGPFDRKDGVLLLSLMRGHKYSSLVFGMNWIFLVTRDNEPFFTSDNPAILSFFSPESSVIDFNNPAPNHEIVFPISPSCILLAHYHNESEYRHKYTFVDPLTVEEMNSRVLHTAHKYIYCSKEEQAVQILNQIQKPA